MRGIYKICILLVFVCLAFNIKSAERIYLDSCVVCSGTSFTDSLPENVKSYSISMNVALSNNADGFGESKSKWGITWAHSQDLYYSITFKYGNTDYGDFLDKRYVDIFVEKVVSGKNKIIKKYRYTKGFDMYTDYNRFVLEVYKDEVRIFGGNNDILHISTLKIQNTMSGDFTIFAKNSDLALSPLIVEYETDMAKILTTKYNSQYLKQYLEKSNDKIEGYWKYLDRNNDPLRARPGGYYRLAIVKENEEYLILYVSDAEVNADEWNTGMLKGRLKPTIFKDHYDLVWYDADMKIMDKDIHAFIVENSILTLEFPIYKTTLRFSKEANR